MLKILNGARLAKDTTTGDIYIVDGCGGAVKLTDAPVVTSIAVTTAPTKTTYAAGETVDTAGMVVTAAYNNGSSAEVYSYTYVPTEPLTSEDTKIIVTHAGKTAEQSITVS